MGSSGRAAAGQLGGKSQICAPAQLLPDLLMEGYHSSWSLGVVSSSSRLTRGAYPNPEELLEASLYPCQRRNQCKIQHGLLW